LVRSSGWEITPSRFFCVKAGTGRANPWGSEDENEDEEEEETERQTKRKRKNEQEEEN